jgi:ferredoxin-type protein NapH
MKKKKWYSLTRLITPVLYSVLIYLGFSGRSMAMMYTMLLVSLLFGAFHCGWLCPFGFIQELLGKLGKTLKLPRLNIPKKWDNFLRFTRYILLGLSFLGLGFTWYLTSPYSTTLSYLSGYAAPLTWATGGILTFFLLLSLFTDRPFCRYFCTKGAGYGALSMGRLFTIRRNKETCINCRLCDKACPMGIEVSKVSHIRNFQCINCFDCMAACPKENTLIYGWAFKKSAKEINNEKENQ